MPDPKRVSWAELKIGIMATVAMAILGVLIFLLTGSGDLFESKSTLYTYMADSAAMATSTPVRLNGIAIGQIDSIEFSGLKDPNKIVRIRMRVRSEMLPQIPEDSEVSVTAANLLGEKFINIEKGASATPVKENGELKAKDIQDIPELMTRAGDLLGSLNVTLRRVDSMLGEIEAGRGNIGKLVRDEAFYNELTATVREANKLVSSMNSGKGILPRLLNDEQFAEEIRSPIRRFDTIMADLQAGQGTAGKFLKDPSLFDESRGAVADLRRMINTDLKKIVDDLNAGRGTAGKLLKDEELHGRINKLVADLNATMDRINSGQGTVGQLITNPQLYESLSGMTSEAQALVKDIRANPKKFLRIRLGLF
jgi:phospholipid/cholesterol/gamma-HCH transport system substrate-binding protein